MKKIILAALGIAALSGCASHPDHSANQTQICEPITESQVIGLFDRWNNSLQTGDPKAVVANYAPRSILLPTVSNQNRLTPAEKEDYFIHFLKDQPFGEVTARQIDIGCNTVTDSGYYTFNMKRTGKPVHGRYTYTYHWQNGQWLITHHHSSKLP